MTCSISLLFLDKSVFKQTTVPISENIYLFLLFMLELKQNAFNLLKSVAIDLHPTPDDDSPLAPRKVESQNDKSAASTCHFWGSHGHLSMSMHNVFFESTWTQT